MKDGQPKLIKLDDYQSPGYLTYQSELTFDIEDGSTRVTSRLHVRRVRSGETEIYLNGEELELDSPAKFPPSYDIADFQEPFIRAFMMIPAGMKFTYLRTGRLTVMAFQFI